MPSDDWTLERLHDAPWSLIEGARVRVKQEVTDGLDPFNEQPDTRTEVREGTITGRGAGTGLSYDREIGEVVPNRIGPAIYLNTPHDTVLEVRTDKPENELLSFSADGRSDSNRE